MIQDDRWCDGNGGIVFEREEKPRRRMINLPQKMIAGEIKKLVPVLGKQNADRLYRAYLLADEDTKIRLIELLDVIKAAVLSNPELRDTILMEAPSQASATAGDIEMVSRS